MSLAEQKTQPWFVSGDFDGFFGLAIQLAILWIRKIVRTATPPNQMLTGVLGVGFLVVSACRFTLVCMAQSIISCTRIYR